MKVCRSLGISLKRFHGWEPSYTAEYDEAGRLTGFVRETEWDETERDWMLALDDYEASMCPGCGLPLDVCRNGEFAIDHEARVCWGSAHRATAVKQWREEHPKDANGDHLMTMLSLKTEQR